MSLTAKELGEVLTGMGPTAKAVAKTLSASRIVGVRNTVRTLNPVVRYVQGTLLISCFGMDLIIPGSFRITLVDKRKVESPLPSAVQEFLSEFDQGLHPALEMSAAEHAQIGQE